MLPNGFNAVILADLSTSQDITTGERLTRVEKAVIVSAYVDLVGLATQQFGQAQGFNLAYSLEMERYKYNGEKYAFMQNTLYEVKSLSKAKMPNKMNLNIQQLDDVDKKQAVEDWKNANL